MGDTGTEQPLKSSGKTHISDQRGTESGTLPRDFPRYPPGLARIIEAWPTLPEHIKAAVLSLISAGSDR